MNTSILQVTKWEEPDAAFIQQTGLSTVRAEYAVSGHANGVCRACYTLRYHVFDSENPHASQAEFLGYTLFEGEIAGKKGSFVVEEKGEHTANGLVSEWVLLPGAAKNGLTGLTGKTGYSIQGGKIVLATEF